ncbi:hypothetical protein ACTSEZ_21225 [Metabacillus sp. JX24]|uniref:hypothetical protein n=1 Tax=Metabacillus sp. JX24 TaxID=3240759 RepID=UPI00350F4E69
MTTVSLPLKKNEDFTMYTYQYTDEQRQYMQRMIDKLERESMLIDTSSSQVEANEWRIKQLRWLMDKKQYPEEPYASMYYELFL